MCWLGKGQKSFWGFFKDSFELARVSFEMVRPLRGKARFAGNALRPFPAALPRLSPGDPLRWAITREKRILCFTIVFFDLGKQDIIRW